MKTPSGLADKIKISTELSRGGVLRWGGGIELRPRVRGLLGTPMFNLISVSILHS